MLERTASLIRRRAMVHHPFELANSDHGIYEYVPGVFHADSEKVAAAVYDEALSRVGTIDTVFDLAVDVWNIKFARPEQHLMRSPFSKTASHKEEYGIPDFKTPVLRELLKDKKAFDPGVLAPKIADLAHNTLQASLVTLSEDAFAFLDLERASTLTDISTGVTLAHSAIRWAQVYKQHDPELLYDVIDSDLAALKGGPPKANPLKVWENDDNSIKVMTAGFGPVVALEGFELNTEALNLLTTVVLEDEPSFVSHPGYTHGYTVRSLRHLAMVQAERDFLDEDTSRLMSGWIRANLRDDEAIGSRFFLGRRADKFAVLAGMEIFNDFVDPLQRGARELLSRG